MAKFLSAEEVGVYGLFVVLVSYSLYAVGFDFYTFSTRELVLKDKKNGKLLKVKVFNNFCLYCYITNYSFPC